MKVALEMLEDKIDISVSPDIDIKQLHNVVMAEFFEERHFADDLSRYTLERAEYCDLFHGDDIVGDRLEAPVDSAVATMRHHIDYLEVRYHLVNVVAFVTWAEAAQRQPGQATPPQT